MNQILNKLKIEKVIEFFRDIFPFLFLVLIVFAVSAFFNGFKTFPSSLLDFNKSIELTINQREVNYDEFLNKFISPLETILLNRGIASNVETTIGRNTAHLKLDINKKVKNPEQEISTIISQLEINKLGTYKFYSEDYYEEPLSTVLISSQVNREQFEDQFSEVLQNLYSINGISKIEYDGIGNENIIIEIDENTLNNNSIDKHLIFETLEKYNNLENAGEIEIGDQVFSLKANVDNLSIEAIRNLGIADSGLTLKDVSKIYLASEVESTGYFFQERGKTQTELVKIDIFADKNSNSITTLHAINNLISQINSGGNIKSELITNNNFDNLNRYILISVVLITFIALATKFRQSLSKLFLSLTLSYALTVIFSSGTNLTFDEITLPISLFVSLLVSIYTLRNLNSKLIVNSLLFFGGLFLILTQVFNFENYLTNFFGIILSVVTISTISSLLVSFSKNSFHQSNKVSILKLVIFSIYAISANYEFFEKTLQTRSIDLEIKNIFSLLSTVILAILLNRINFEQIFREFLKRIENYVSQIVNLFRHVNKHYLLQLNRLLFSKAYNSLFSFFMVIIIILFNLFSYFLVDSLWLDRELIGGKYKTFVMYADDSFDVHYLKKSHDQIISSLFNVTEIKKVYSGIKSLDNPHQSLVFFSINFFDDSKRSDQEILKYLQDEMKLITNSKISLYESEDPFSWNETEIRIKDFNQNNANLLKEEAIFRKFSKMESILEFDPTNVNFEELTTNTSPIEYSGVNTTNNIIVRNNLDLLNVEGLKFSSITNNIEYRINSSSVDKITIFTPNFQKDFNSLSKTISHNSVCGKCMIIRGNIDLQLTSILILVSVSLLVFYLVKNHRKSLLIISPIGFPLSLISAGLFNSLIIHPVQIVISILISLIIINYLFMLSLGIGRDFELTNNFVASIITAISHNKFLYFISIITIVLLILFTFQLSSKILFMLSQAILIIYVSVGFPTIYTFFYKKSDA